MYDKIVITRQTIDTIQPMYVIAVRVVSIVLGGGAVWTVGLTSYDKERGEFHVIFYHFIY